MKLPRYPKGLFDRTHSGKRFSASDMPLLRSMRDVYASLLQKISAIDWSEEGPGMALAAARIRRDLEEKRRVTGRILTLLERTPPAWRP